MTTTDATIHDELTALMRSGADHIDAHGWTQGRMEDEHGATCLTGSLRACAPQPGDWRIGAAVARHLGHAESWNDADERTEGEVTAWLRTVEVTDDDLAETFGPQWVEIVALVRRAAVLTEAEASRLVAARYAAWNAAWNAARVAARVAARDAAWNAACNAAWNAAGDDASDVAVYTATTLVVRDLIGQHGYTQDHYDALTWPWRQVIGPLHPDDPDLTKAGGAA